MGAGIVAMISITLYLAIAQSLAVLQVTRENLRATQILAEKLEVIRLCSWDQINQAGFLPTNFTADFYPSGSQGTKGVRYNGTVTITQPAIAETYAGNMKLVTLNLTWVSSKIQRQREMRTYVSRYGLQNYVYPIK